MPVSRPSFPALLGLLGLLLAGAAVADAPSGAVGELLATDAARAQATVAAEVAALEAVLGDDLTYGHSNGRVQGKRAYIDDLRSGTLRYKSLVPAEVTARAFGCAGVVTGTAQAEVESAGNTLSMHLGYTATYARRHDHWVLVAYQSVRLP